MIAPAVDYQLALALKGRQALHATDDRAAPGRADLGRRGRGAQLAEGHSDRFRSHHATAAVMPPMDQTAVSASRNR